MKRRKGPNRSRQPKNGHRTAPRTGETGWSRKVREGRRRRSEDQGDRQSWTPDDEEYDS